jgi:hypothetical protein
MATTSLVTLDLEKLISKVERITKLRLPQRVLEATLEPDIDLLCLRFKKPRKAELGEPVHPLVHVFREKASRGITAVEIVNPEALIKS